MLPGPCYFLPHSIKAICCELFILLTRKTAFRSAQAKQYSNLSLVRGNLRGFTYFWSAIDKEETTFFAISSS